MTNNIYTKDIPVILCINNIYCQQTAALIKSIICNSKFSNYKFYILHSSVDEKNQNLLRQVFNDIEFINIQEYVDKQSIEKYENTNKSINYISSEMYYRLFIPDIFKQYDKVLYLDSDMTVIKDISELYNIDIDNYYAGVVEGKIIKEFIRKNQKVDTYPQYNWKQYLSIKLNKKDLRYFNSGMLLLNLKKLREDGIQQKIFEFLKKESPLEFPDQDVLNAFFDEKAKYLPEKYNTFHAALTKETVIIHFVGKEKPWNYYKSNESFEHFWKYLKLTPFWNAENEKIYEKLKRNYFVCKFLGVEFFRMRQDERHYKIKFLFIHLTVNKKWLKIF